MKLVITTQRDYQNKQLKIVFDVEETININGLFEMKVCISSQIFYESTRSMEWNACFKR